MAQRFSSWGVAALALAITGAQANAEFFYSVDIANSELVLIDSVSGEVASVGSIGEGLPDTDLAVADDRLYGTVRFPNNELVEFDLGSGQIVFRVDLPFLSTIKGLGADSADQLICGYSDGGHTDSVLAALGLDGSVTPITPELGYDIDGLGLAPDDTRYAVDIAIPSTVAEVGPPVVILDALGADANDVAATATDLWALASGGALVRISRATGLQVGTIQLNSAGRELYGIALAPCVGDMDHDGDTDVFDFGVFGVAFGSVPGDAHFNPDCDINNDDAVDVFDFGIFTADFGCGAGP